MRHRWLIRILFIGLFLLCIAMWGWSYPFREHIDYTGRTGFLEWEFEIGDGGIFMGRNWGFSSPNEAFHWHYEHLGQDPWAGEIYTAGFRLFGFQFFRSPMPHAGMVTFVIIPLWFVSSMSALALVLVWRKTEKSNRDDRSWTT